MESQSLKLSLNLSPPWLAGDENNQLDESNDLRNYLARLKHELRKIESFKRELPLSVRLLTNAIGRLKEVVGRSDQELARAECDLNESPRSKSEVTVAVNNDDKKNWMRSAQLWSSDHASNSIAEVKITRDGAEEGQACRYRDKRGALLSFTEVSEISPARDDVDRSKPVLVGPALYSQVRPEPVAACRKTFVPVFADQIKLRYQASLSAAAAAAVQGTKKQRRCWSPELHRRFIDSLEKLGGSQVATPKQIREMMQVNGLTNDEVKSHLQKYRLHIRKHPNSIKSSSNKVFTSHDSKTECSGGGAGGVTAMKAESGSPQGPLQLALRSGKCNSAASRCRSNEDDGEEKSDSHSWGSGGL